ncbi:MAG: ABC transporter permease subunit [Chloroflexota bacterium]
MDFDFLAAYPRVLLDAALLTIALSLAALLGGGCIGLLVAVARTLGGRVVDLALGVVVDLIRGTPLLVQLLIWYLGSSLLRFELSPFAAAAVGLSVNAGAFISGSSEAPLRRSLAVSERQLSPSGWDGPMP